MAIAPPGDATLIRYLLGQADREDEERFDELSVTDATFAERLRAIEHDLADAYVRGELSRHDRARWEERYLVSRHGRDDRALAEALAAREHRGRRLVPATWWLLAAAAVLVLAVAGGSRLVHRGRPSVSLAQQQPVTTPSPPPAPAAAAPIAHVVALTLSPSIRSIDTTPTLEIPAGTTDVKLTLRLDRDESKSYRIAIRDLTANAVVWDSPDMAAEGAGVTRSIVVSIPASTFQTRRYLINVSAGSADARAIVATYAVVVVLH